MLIISNKGQAIAETNFWSSDMALRGYCYLTWNAGAARLLLPPSQEGNLKDMKSSKQVVITRGYMPEFDLTDALEIMFDDRSDSPFCLFICREQTDYIPKTIDYGRDFWLTVWTKRGQQLRLPAVSRPALALPCLEPWKPNVQSKGL
jgi:hypothetical protein